MTKTNDRTAILLTAAVALVVAATAVPAATAEDTDFRRGRWGDSPAAVKAAETLDVSQEETSDGVTVLVYEDELAGLAAEAAYLFQDGELYQGVYRFNERHTDHAEHIADFERLHALLTEKYGEPESSGTRWINELFKGNPDNWDEALVAGHVSWAATWVTERTKIQMALFGKAFRVQHGITYESRAGEAERDAEQEAEEKQKALGDL